MESGGRPDPRGQVYQRLLIKMERQRKAYGGRLFDVLGDAFSETPLRTLLMDAIRYGDDPARIAEIERVVDAQVADGCTELVEGRALARETLGPLELDRLRRAMDDATARRLQPHYIEKFFVDAFGALGGQVKPARRLAIRSPNVPGHFAIGRFVASMRAARWSPRTSGSHSSPPRCRDPNVPSCSPRPSAAGHPARRHHRARPAGVE